jgi:hypothetical protein
MPLTLRIVMLAALAIAAACPARHAQQRLDAAEHARRAIAAYEAKDYAAYLEHMRSANELRPHHPRLMYNLASAFALNGKADEAVGLLDRVAAMGLVYPAATDEDFASIRESAAFKTVVARFASNAAPVHRGEVALTVPLRGFIMEGIAYDPVERVFYASSVRERRVVRVDAKGAVTEVASARDGLWSALGIHVDAKRRRLWVATAAMPQTLGIEPSDVGRSGLLELDLTTGKRARVYLLPKGDGANVLGDLAIAADGTVFATDSSTPALYVLRPGAAALERFAAGLPLASPQGLDLSADGRRLYVADYARGVFVVDPTAGTWARLETPEAICLLGVDGLYVHGGSLLAIQNGVNPHRVVRVSLDRTGTRAERLEVLEASTPHLEEPTLGTVDDGWFYFVANSQWNQFDDKNQLPPPADLRDHVVMRVRL